MLTYSTEFPDYWHLPGFFSAANAKHRFGIKVVGEVIGFPEVFFDVEKLSDA
jgi:hypothetical protein